MKPVLRTLLLAYVFAVYLAFVVFALHNNHRLQMSVSLGILTGFMGLYIGRGRIV